MSSLLPEERDWELAGLPQEDSGLLGAPGLRFWQLSGVEAELTSDDTIQWRLPTYDRKRDLEPVSPEGMLDQFVRIKDAGAVLKFARKWGVLELCMHDLPASHNQPSPPGLELSQCHPRGYAFTDTWTKVGGWEPIEPWFVFSGLMRATLSAVAALENGNEPAEEDLEQLRHSSLTVSKGNWVLGQPEELKLFPPRLYIDITCSILSGLAGISPEVRFRSGKPTLAFNAKVFGMLTMQLFQALTRSHGVAICSGCGIPYGRTGRKVQTGRRNYCPKCGPKTALRDAQRDYKARHPNGTTKG